MKKPRSAPHARYIALLSLLLLLLPLITGCFFVSYPTPPAGETVTAPTAPGEITYQPATLPAGTVIAPDIDYDAMIEANLAALHKKNMNEASFFLLTTCAERFSPTLSEEENLGRLIDSEVIKRNQLVEELYNVRLLTIAAQEDVLLDMVWGAKWAGEYVADLVEIPSRLLGEFAEQKLAYNLNSLPFLDLTADYFNRDAIAQCSAGYFTYAAAGNANRYLDLTLCIYYNESYFDADLYDICERGRWTWDTLFALCGDHGILMPANLDAGEMMLASFDLHLLQTGYGAYPEAMEDKSGIEAAAAMTAKLLAAAELDGGMEAFARGEAPFLIAKTSEYGALATATFDWGVLPLPKGSTEQTRHVTLSTLQTLYVAPPTMASTENTGLILQALNAATLDQVSSIMAEHALLTVAQNAKTCNMLSTLGKQIFYDFAYNIAVGYESIENASTLPYLAAINGESSFAEGYAKAEKNLKYWNPRNFG